MVWNVCVLGAGINGLAVARELQIRLGNAAKITIVTDKISPNTTSDVAAGLWMPHLVNGKDAELLKKWGVETFNYIAKLERQSPYSGAFMCSGYTFDNSPPEADFAEAVYRNFKPLTREQICDLGFSDFKNGNFGYGNFYTTYFLEPSIYLRNVTAEFKRADGEIIEKRVKNVDEIAEKYDLIVNCSGLGSRDLFGDKDVIPIRGQVIRVKFPSMKHFYIIDGRYHCFPNTATVVLGGTKGINDYNLNVSASDSNTILSVVQKYLPQLKDAEIVGENVGLRPFRKNIRLEKEIYETMTGKKVPVVHNYGHGGSGITLFYGCALDAADLVEYCLKNRSKI